MALWTKFGTLGSPSSEGECLIPELACIPSDSKDRNASYIIILIIMTFALLWEAAIELMENFCPVQLKPVIQKVVFEFAELGMVSLLVYLPSQSNWFVNLSGNIFGDCNHLLHLVHDTHFLVFYATLTFLVFVVILMLSSIWWIRQWRTYEKAANEEPDIEKVRQYQQRHPLLRFYCLLVAGSSSIDYRLVREDFLKAVNAEEERKAWDVGSLQFDFEFHTYLKHQQQKFYIRLVNISAASWCTLFVVTAICFSFTLLELQQLAVLCVLAQGALLTATLVQHVLTVWLYQCLSPKLNAEAVAILEERAREPGSAPPQATSSCWSVRSHPTYVEDTVYPTLADTEADEVTMACDTETVHDGAHSPSSPKTPNTNYSSCPQGIHRQSTLPASPPTVLNLRHIPSLGILNHAPTVDQYGELSQIPSEEPCTPMAQLTLPTSGGSTLDINRREALMRYSMQVILLLTGINIAFFIEVGGPFLVNSCSFEGTPLNGILLAIQILMVILEAIILLQTIRVHTFLYSHGRFKNYASITWVLHRMALKKLLLCLKEECSGQKDYPDTRSLARALFNHLKKEPATSTYNQEPAISARVLHERLISYSEKSNVPHEIVLVLMRHMDTNGDGYIQFHEFYQECKYVFDI